MNTREKTILRFRNNWYFCNVAITEICEKIVGENDLNMPCDDVSRLR